MNGDWDTWTIDGERIGEYVETGGNDGHRRAEGSCKNQWYGAEDIYVG